MTVSAAQIWEKLTPSQRATLLNEAGHSPYAFSTEGLLRAGLMKRGDILPAQVSGAARHALGRKGLLEIGQTVAAPLSAASFYTPRKMTALGKAVAAHGRSIVIARGVP